MYEPQLYYKQILPQILFGICSVNQLFLKKNILQKCLRCTSVSVKWSIKLDLCEEALKILMYLLENILDESIFSVNLQVQSLSLRFYLKHFITEFFHKSFARLFLLNFGKFSVRYLCHSFCEKFGDI